MMVIDLDLQEYIQNVMLKNEYLEIIQLIFLWLFLQKN
jgi:hypothetical protein